MVFLVAYMIFVKYSPLLTISLIIIMFLLDAVDGYIAKHIDKKSSPFGPRIDVAGDRITEYTFWVIFTYLNIIPLFVILLVIIRHSVADAFMGFKGTSSKLKTSFARAVYGSGIGRGGVGVVKVITFSYLALVYMTNYQYPILVGYALTAILVVYILLRGAAEVYESIESSKGKQ